MGGYLASLYALTHQTDIIRLLLLSPVGIPQPPPGFDYATIWKKFDTFPKRLGGRLALSLWDKGLTPFQLLRLGGYYPTRGFLKFFLAIRLPKVTEPEEKEDLKNYMH